MCLCLNVKVRKKAFSYKNKVLVWEEKHYIIISPFTEKQISQGLPGHLAPNLQIPNHMYMECVFTCLVWECLILQCVCVSHGVLVLQRHHCRPPCTAELIYKRSNQPRFTTSVCVCMCVLCIQPFQIYSGCSHPSWEIEWNQGTRERDSTLQSLSLSHWSVQGGMRCINCATNLVILSVGNASSVVCAVVLGGHRA